MLVEEKTAKARRREVEDRLVALAAKTRLNPDDAIVVLFLACLYGSGAARKVIKPNEPDDYNVLCDLHAVSRIGLIKAIVRHTGQSTKVYFRTLDEGLDEVLGYMKFADCRITSPDRLSIKIQYRSGLFPDLAETDVGALFARLNVEYRSSIETKLEYQITEG
ncbi:hypothetical protein [Burkholderia cenocepacia]|uniref:hypothetical protein n=1 Tax=Burkholderia cenocepacia TaxID=95486 RepID=UPI000D0C5395|nr:hypothetical protein [Burkholderia cenocepacia]SOT45988.1 hypothetical protein F01_560043 [Burkholderia cenocepacia]